MKTDIVIPAYNESEKILDTVNAVLDIEDVRVIVVDDKSMDNTADIVEGVKAENLVCLRLPENGGKGKAVKAGIDYSDADIVCLLDADLGSTASEARKLIEPVRRGETDFTIARFGKAKKKGGFGFVKRIAAWGVKHYTGREMTTVLSGQRAYRREAVEAMKYIPDDFGMEVAMTVEALNAGFDFKDIDVVMTHSETGRDISGFRHRGKQFWDILKTIIKLKFKIKRAV